MKKSWIAVLVLALVGCLASGAYIVYYKVNEKKAESSYEEMKEIAEVDSSEDNEVTEEPKESKNPKEPEVSKEPETTKEPEATKAPEKADPTETPVPTEPPVEIPIDFKALQQENDEIYAWIRIPDTVIDYPVLQSSTDDSFYIHKGVDREYLFAGAIYSEMKNAKDFSDPNTVLYGHNMKDGSMFASLHNFKDRDYFDKNREILIYTPEHIYHYLIFAAYTYDDRHLLNSFDFSNKEVFEDYLEEVYNLRSMDAYFVEEPKVTADDKIITLSTCVGNNASARYLVQGVLTEME